MIERKIPFMDDGDLIVSRDPSTGIALAWRIGGDDVILLRNLTPDDARKIAAMLIEIAGERNQPPRPTTAPG
jgi:hypothetical protein